MVVSLRIRFIRIKASRAIPRYCLISNWCDVSSSTLSLNHHQLHEALYLVPTKAFGEQVCWIAFCGPFFEYHPPPPDQLLDPEVPSGQVADSTKAFSFTHANRSCGI